MPSTLSKINVISRLLKVFYGDYWSKWQGAIIFKTSIPFVFCAILYLWYRSIRNALAVLNLGSLPTKPWAPIVEWPYYGFLVIVVTLIFILFECLTSIFQIKSTRKMLSELRVEAKKLFEIQEKMEDLSRTMKLSLLKIVAKYTLVFFVRFARYMIFLSIPIIIITLVGFLLGTVIHIEILFWVYTRYKDATILGIAPFSIFEMAKQYLFHPYMAIIYTVPFLFLLGFTETITANLERRGKRASLHGFSVLLPATNVLYRIARAFSITLRCIVEDVRQASFQVMILSSRDLQRAIIKNMGRNQRVCMVTLHTHILDELEEDEKEELRGFFEELIPRILKRGKTGEIIASIMKKRGERMSKEFKKAEGHALFALLEEGCKFYALGQKVFKLSVKYAIWCEDPFVKEKIIALAGK